MFRFFIFPTGTCCKITVDSAWKKGEKFESSPFFLFRCLAELLDVLCLERVDVSGESDNSAFTVDRLAQVDKHIPT